jgi:putative DNA primase/helicase
MLRSQEREEIIAFLQRNSTETPNAPRRALRSLTIEELFKLDVKPREMLLHPFLPVQGLSMLYSLRGVGKTYIGLGIAVAVASGGSFLRWSAPKARRVLYVDGEMPLTTLRERLASIVSGSKTELQPENIRIITPDVQTSGLPDISTVSGQAEIEAHLDGAQLIILDNLSALVRTGKENEGEGWLPVQEWALALRRKGVSVLFVHHAGKAGAQRGTSRREDLLDSVLTLKLPSDYSPEQGLRAEVLYEKARGFFGTDAKPFEVRMRLGESQEAIWAVSDSSTSKEERALELLAGGMSVRDVAEEIGLSKSTVQRLKKNGRTQPWEMSQNFAPRVAESGTVA